MKTFFSTLVGLVVIVILAAVIVGFIFWSRVPDIVANHLSQKLKVSVEIDSFGFGWGKIDAKKIQIGNPPNSTLAKAFACDQIDVLAPFTNYLSKKIIIDQIDLQNVYLGLEFDSASGTSGNWTKIMGNLNQSMGADASAATRSKTKKKKTQQTQQTTSGSFRSVLIHRIVLTNIDVDVIYKKEGGKVKRLPRIPRIELTEISSEGGLPMDQILNSVLGEMLKQVFLKENLKNMMQDFMNAPGPAQQYLAPFKGLFNTAPQEVDRDAIGA
jgi:uncharacterized protein involved in outer membrane biogenesis